MLAALTVGLACCQSGPPRPVEIALNEEACRNCRMAISERKYAAEVVPASGEVQFFDDIGCMVQWMRVHKPEKARIFVVDMISGAWLDAHASYYVRSSRYRTPMGFGIVAFRGLVEARAAAGETEGRLLTWEQLLAESLS